MTLVYLVTAQSGATEPATECPRERTPTQASAIVEYLRVSATN
jgi:hypothetical protein